MCWHIGDLGLGTSFFLYLYIFINNPNQSSGFKEQQSGDDSQTHEEFSMLVKNMNFGTRKPGFQS